MREIAAPGHDVPLEEMGLTALGVALRKGQVSSLALTEYVLERIERHDGAFHSFVTVTADLARTQACAADRAFEEGRDLGPLQGIPYGLKDIFEVADVRMTCNSHAMPHEYVSPVSCTLYDRLVSRGAVLLGKLATHEFALGGPSAELPFPPARNPWNTDHFTGASSSGSAAAVAARLLPLSFGSDTSGSIRGPASYCGVVGFKPTYGYLPRSGVFPLSYSLDHVGPIARSTTDCALAAQALAGADPADPSSRDPASPFGAELGRSLAGRKIGAIKTFLPPETAMHPEVGAAIFAALDRMAEAGAQIVDVELPPFAEFNACGRTLMMAEAYAIHADRLREAPLAYGRFTYQRIVQGAFLTAKDYIRAQQARRRLSAAFQAVSETVDVLIGPGSLYPPPRLDEFGGDWPPKPHLTATQTIVANVVGAPAISIPIGWSHNGLPLGLQVMAAPHRDAVVLSVAQALEQLVRFASDRPQGVLAAAPSAAD